MINQAFTQFAISTISEINQSDSSSHTTQNPYPYLLKGSSHSLSQLQSQSQSQSQSVISQNCPQGQRVSALEKSDFIPGAVLEKLSTSPSPSRPSSPHTTRRSGTFRPSGSKCDANLLTTPVINDSNNNNNITLDNHIGCLRSLKVISARADERARNRTLATRRKSLELEKQMETVCRNIEEKYGKEERRILAEEITERKKTLLKIICLSLVDRQLTNNLFSQIVINREEIRINIAKSTIIRVMMRHGLKIQEKRRSKLRNAMLSFTLIFIRMVRMFYDLSYSFF